MSKEEFSAGGIVYKKTKEGPLIAMMLDPYYKWGFPKGHIEKGETPEETALAESEEELGLKNLKVIAPLGETEIWFRERFRHGKPVAQPGERIHKNIHFFLLEASSDAQARPQKEEKIRAVEWISPDEAHRRLKYKNMIPILDRAISLIEQGK